MRAATIVIGTFIEAYEEEKTVVGVKKSVNPAGIGCCVKHAPGILTRTVGSFHFFLAETRTDGKLMT